LIIAFLYPIDTGGYIYVKEPHGAREELFLSQRYIPPVPIDHRTYAVRLSYRCPLVDQCVYYVVTRTGIKIRGNANTWIDNAESFGYRVYPQPKVGAAVSISTYNLYGHIAVVEKILPDAITVSEQNYQECGSITWRTISLDDPQILGYIY